MKTKKELCKYCGGEIAIRNPTGKCDHLYFPNNLSHEAKLVNGFQLIIKQVPEWVSTKLV